MKNCTKVCEYVVTVKIGHQTFLFRPLDAGADTLEMRPWAYAHAVRPFNLPLNRNHFKVSHSLVFCKHARLAVWCSE